MSIKRNLESIAILFILIIIITPIVDKLDLSQFYPLTELYTVFGVILAGVVYVYLQKNSSEWDMIDNLAIAILLFASVEQLLQWQVFQYNQTLWPSIWIVMPISILIRMIIKELKQTKNNQKPPLKTVYDLNDLLDDDNFSQNFKNWNREQYILFSENIDTIDLLNRKNTIVPNITATINNCYYPQKGFVIALTGPWGSGKSTVIKMVATELANNPQLEIIDNFSFWKYDNKEALLQAVIERLLEVTPALNFREKQALIESALAVISEKSGFDFRRILSSDIDVSKLKAKLGKYLTTNNQRIVFVIDDLERTNAEIVVMIFKVIATVLDIPNIIYLLSYDESEMKKHFAATKIEFDYTDKIINQKFTLPKIVEADLTLQTKKVLLKLAEIYGRTEALKQTIDEIVELMPIENIRDLKRRLNSLMPYIQKNELGLNERDRLLINYIKFKDNELWENLYNNEQYLTDGYSLYYKTPKLYDWFASNMRKSGSKKKFDDSRKEYLEKLKTENPKFERIIECLFLKSNKNGLEHDNYHNVKIVSAPHFAVYFEELSGMHTTIISKIKTDLATQGEINEKYIHWIQIFSNSQTIIFRYLNAQIEEYSQYGYELSVAILDNIRLLDKSGLLAAAEYIALYFVNKRIDAHSSVIDLLFKTIKEKPNYYYFYKRVANQIFSSKNDRDLGIDSEIKEAFQTLMLQLEETIINHPEKEENNDNIQMILWDFLNNTDDIHKNFEDETIINWLQHQVAEKSAIIFLETIFNTTRNQLRKEKSFLEYEENWNTYYEKSVAQLEISEQLQTIDIEKVKRNLANNSSAEQTLDAYAQWLEYKKGRINNELDTFS